MLGSRAGETMKFQKTKGYDGRPQNTGRPDPLPDRESHKRNLCSVTVAAELGAKRLKADNDAAFDALLLEALFGLHFPMPATPATARQTARANGLRPDLFSTNTFKRFKLHAPVLLAAVNVMLKPVVNADVNDMGVPSGLLQFNIADCSADAAKTRRMNEILYNIILVMIFFFPDKTFSGVGKTSLAEPDPSPTDIKQLIENLKNFSLNDMWTQSQWSGQKKNMGKSLFITGRHFELWEILNMYEKNKDVNTHCIIAAWFAKEPKFKKAKRAVNGKTQTLLAKPRHEIPQQDMTVDVRRPGVKF